MSVPKLEFWDGEKWTEMLTWQQERIEELEAALRDILYCVKGDTMKDIAIEVLTASPSAAAQAPAED